MGMPIILGWAVSLLGNSSRRERWRRLTQFSSIQVFLTQARNDWHQRFHLVLVITQPERKPQALLLPSHYVDSWGFSEIACRGSLPQGRVALRRLAESTQKMMTAGRTSTSLSSWAWSLTTRDLFDACFLQWICGWSAPKHVSELRDVMI